MPTAILVAVLSAGSVLAFTAYLMRPGPPLTGRRLLGQIGQGLVRRGWLNSVREHLDRQLELAGRPNWTADEVLAARLVSSAVLGLLGLTVGPLWGVASVVAGYNVPSLFLRDLIKRRQRCLRRELLPFLAQLTAGVEAGADPEAAMRLVSALMPGVLAAEFGMARQEQDLGRSREEALHRLGHRCGLEEVDALCRALVNSTRYDAELGPVLRDLADRIQSERDSAAEARAGKAAVNLILPTTCLLLPAIFLMAIAPIAIHFVRQFR